MGSSHHHSANIACMLGSQSTMLTARAGLLQPQLLDLSQLPTSIMGGAQVLWWKSGLIPPLGVYPYWTDPFSLFFIEIIAVQFAELKRCGPSQTCMDFRRRLRLHMARVERRSRYDIDICDDDSTCFESCISASDACVGAQHNDAVLRGCVNHSQITHVMRACWSLGAGCRTSGSRAPRASSISWA